MKTDMQMIHGAAEKQDGAVAIIAAVVIAFVAITLLAFSADIGSLWQSQRALVTDTDSAALAGAIELAEDWMETDECDEDVAKAEAERVLGLNDPEADAFDILPSAGCQIDSDAFIGQVQMTASQQSPGFVSGQELSARGTTTATFELLLGETQGLAVCQNLFDFASDSDPQRFAKDDFVVKHNGTDYLLFPYKFAEQTLDEYGSPGSCKVAPSNEGSPFTAGGWGWLEGPCDLKDGARGTWCDAKTGTQALKDALGDLEVGQRIDFPIFEEAKDPGKNASYFIVGRVEVEVAGACGKGGSESNEVKGFDPETDCTLPPSGKLQGQPAFIAVTDWVVTYFGDNNAMKFRDASYSICDVDGTGDYCPELDLK